MKPKDRARELLFRLEYPHDETYTRRLALIEKAFEEAGREQAAESDLMRSAAVEDAVAEIQERRKIVASHDGTLLAEFTFTAALEDLDGLCKILNLGVWPKGLEIESHDLGAAPTEGS